MVRNIIKSFKRLYNYFFCEECKMIRIAEKNNKIANCPICKSDKTSVIHWEVILDFGLYCRSCDANTKEYHETPKSAIEAWNKGEVIKGE